MSKKRPRLWYPYTLNGHIISLGVGFAYYTVTAVQSLNRIISKSSHALFFYWLSSGNWLATKLINYMRIKAEEGVYEAPIVEVIEVEVEKGFATSNVENPTMGNESGW